MTDAILNAFNNLKIEQPAQIAKKPHGKSGQSIPVVTNVVPLQLQPNVPFFKYDFRAYALFAGKDGRIHEKELTKQTRDDFTEQERKSASVLVMREMLKQAVFKDKVLIYDRAAILFSLEQLPGIGDGESRFDVPSNIHPSTKEATKIEVRLKRATDSFQVSTSDLKNVAGADMRGGGKELLEVLNIATSKKIFDNPELYITYGNGCIYLLDPASCGFRENETPSISNDKYMGIGLNKSVKVIEGAPGAKGGCAAGLVVDVKKTAFHFDNQPMDQKLDELMKERGQPTQAIFRGHLQPLSLLLRDLKCITTHNKERTTVVTIGALSKLPVKDMVVDRKDGSRMTLPEYYLKKYNIKLKRADLPAILNKFDKNAYPAELLIVAPNQRVKTNQATRDMIDVLIKASATHPDNRLAQTAILAKQLSSPLVAKTGITIPPINSKEDFTRAALTVNGRAMPPVQLLNGKRFTLPASLAKWAAVHLTDRPVNCFQDFVNWYAKMGNDYGMQIAKPAFVKILGQYQVAEAMGVAKAQGLQFVLFVSDDRNKDHDEIKALEHEHGILTQEIKTKTVSRMMEKRQSNTLENILRKTNEKLGGVNSVLKPESGSKYLHARDTLVIGLTITQPRGMLKSDYMAGRGPEHPVVIAWGSNSGRVVQGGNAATRDTAGRLNFSGGYRYANPAEWSEANGGNGKMELCLISLFVDILKEFKANRGVTPARLVVYRGGVSDGQLKEVASKEKSLWQAAFSSLSPNYKPNLFIIAAAKDHTDRLYRKDIRPDARVPDKNLAPGSVVDSGIVNPERNEFYLIAHKALQGTAKATKYSLIVENTPSPITMDELEEMTNGLCNLYQIVSTPVSLPAPLYIADQYAKRGVAQFAYRTGNSLSLENWDIDKVNEEHAVVPGFALSGLRFNA